MSLIILKINIAQIIEKGNKEVKLTSDVRNRPSF